MVQNSLMVEWSVISMPGKFRAIGHLYISIELLITPTGITKETRVSIYDLNTGLLLLLLVHNSNGSIIQRAGIQIPTVVTYDIFLVRLMLRINF